MTEKLGIGTCDTEIFEGFAACRGLSCFATAGIRSLPHSADDDWETRDAATVGGDEPDGVLIAAMMFGGSGTGDCLDGGVGATFGLLVVDEAALAKPSTACFRGGGGLEALEDIGRAF